VKTAALLLLALLLAACTGGGDADTTSTLQPAPLVATTSSLAPGEDTVPSETTTTSIPTGNSRFIIGSVVFGDRGSIEIGNLGPDSGDLTGYWLAIDPFYLELPSTVLAPGTALIVSLDPEADPTVVFPAAGLLPPMKGGSGEIGLYRNGDFRNPDSIVDYVQWGAAEHVRTGVAVAAGLWPEGETIDMGGTATGLTVGDREDPGPSGWAPTGG
jgi:hypothetical protein